MAVSGIRTKLDLFTTTQPWKFSDLEIAGYEDNRIIPPLSIEKNLPALFFGVQSARTVLVTLPNINTALTTDGVFAGVLANGQEYGAGDYPAGGVGDMTISQILAGEEILGKRARLTLEKVDTGASVFLLDGTVTDVRLTNIAATLTIESRDAQVFTELIPKVRLLDIYPNADLTSNTADADTPVIIPFGIMRKVPLVLVAQDTLRSTYDYGLIRKPVTGGGLGLNTVYRDSRVVATNEYLFVESPPGYYVLRFVKEQRDASGRLFRIHVDLQSFEFTWPSDVIELLLSDRVFGLGLPVSAASFTTADTAYSNAGYTVHGGLSKRLTAGEVLNNLLMRGAVLDRDSAGAYTITVDASSLHTAASIQLGCGDNYWENVDPDSVEEVQPKIEERIRTLTLQGLPDPGFEGSGAFLLKAQRTRTKVGVERDVLNPYIGTAATLDRECDYIYKRLINGEKTLSLRASIEVQDYAVNQLATVTIPNLHYHGDQLEIRGIRFDESGEADGERQASFTLTLAGYKSDPFSYTQGTVVAAPGANNSTDYTFTPPNVPTAFSVIDSGVLQGTEGIGDVTMLAEATAPAVNVTHLVFQIFKQGNAFPRSQIIRVVAAGANASATFRVTPGIAYDYTCFARNVANNPGFQDGTVAQLLNQVAPGDTTAPTAPSAIAVRQAGALIVEVTLTFTPPADWGDVQFYRNTTDNSATATVVETKKAKSFHDQNVTYATTYYYWGKVRDLSGNASGFSPSTGHSITIARLVTNDVTDNNITTAKRIANSSQATTSVSMNALDHLHKENLAGTYTQNADTQVTNHGLSSNVTFSFSHSIGKIPIAVMTLTGSVSNLQVLGKLTTLSSTTIDGVIYNTLGSAQTATITVYYW